MCPAKRRFVIAALQHVIESLSAGASACASLRQFCRSSSEVLTVCHSRLQPTRQRYTLSYLRPKDALARCRRRVKRVRFRDVTWEVKGKTRAPHRRGPFARGRRFLLVPVTAAAAPDVLFVCNTIVFFPPSLPVCCCLCPAFLQAFKRGRSRQY